MIHHRDRISHVIHSVRVVFRHNAYCPTWRAPFLFYQTTECFSTCCRCSVLSYVWCGPFQFKLQKRWTPVEFETHFRDNKSKQDALKTGFYSSCGIKCRLKAINDSYIYSEWNPQHIAVSNTKTSFGQKILNISNIPLTLNVCEQPNHVWPNWTP